MTELTPADVIAELFESAELDTENYQYLGSQEIATLILKRLTDAGFEVRSAWPVEAKDTVTPHERETFQQRVNPWLMQCFGLKIARDLLERNHRFLEEAMELVQANGCTITEAHQLVDYVYGRDQGDINQEVGGVMVTLAALCLASGVDMHAAAEAELARVWTKIDKIRAKHFAKPKFSPLPGSDAIRALGGSHE